MKYDATAKTNKKYNLITEIGKVLDENERLQIENESLKLELLKGTFIPNESEAVAEDQPHNIYDDIINHVMLLGLQSIVDYHTLFDYNDIYNESTNEFVTFEAWFESVKLDTYGRRYLPSIIEENLTNKEIVNLFKPYLKDLYKSKVENKQKHLAKENEEVNNND